jgi:hypothetical protein
VIRKKTGMKERAKVGSKLSGFQGDRDKGETAELYGNKM